MLSSILYYRWSVIPYRSLAPSQRSALFSCHHRVPAYGQTSSITPSRGLAICILLSGIAIEWGSWSRIFKLRSYIPIKNKILFTYLLNNKKETERNKISELVFYNYTLFVIKKDKK